MLSRIVGVLLIVREVVSNGVMVSPGEICLVYGLSVTFNALPSTMTTQKCWMSGSV